MCSLDGRHLAVGDVAVPATSVLDALLVFPLHAKNGRREREGFERISDALPRNARVISRLSVERICKANKTRTIATTRTVEAHADAVSLFYRTSIGVRNSGATSAHE